MKKCLMIETKDQKKFFTYEKNLPQLIEFSKVFDAEISVVQILDDKFILELEDLAPAFCETKPISKNEYKILKVKIKSKNKRNSILTRADSIQKHIKDMLIEGNIVSLNDLKTKYKKHKLTTACLCNHFRKTREFLINQGYKITKVGGGKYKIKKGE